jgi:hypothetical protein
MQFIASPVKAGLSPKPSNERSYAGLIESSKVGSQICFDYIKGCNAKGGTQRKNMLKNKKKIVIYMGSTSLSTWKYDSDNPLTQCRFLKCSMI